MNDLARRLSESARKQAERVIEKAEKEIQIAKLYDQAGHDLKEPRHIMASSLYGSVGSISWEEATPEQALAIMKAFPPVPSGLSRDGGTSYRPRTAILEGKEDQYIPGDGFWISLDRILGYETKVRLHWYAQLAGELVRLGVELMNVQRITPEIVGYVRHIGDVVTAIESVHIDWREGATSFALQEVSYGRNDTRSYNNYLIWAYEGDDLILAQVEHWAKLCYQKRQHSRKAYEEDKAAGLEPEPTEVSYQSSDKLRPGTKAQHDCLNTEEARKDKALARRHWLEYITEGGPEAWPSKPSPYQNYFDYYTWACHWLQLHGLYEDNGYKYGSAWL